MIFIVSNLNYSKSSRVLSDSMKVEHTGKFNKLNITKIFQF